MAKHKITHDELMQLMDRAMELMNIFSLEDPVRTTGEALGDVVSHLFHAMAEEYEDELIGKSCDNPMKFVDETISLMKDMSTNGEFSPSGEAEIASTFREILNKVSVISRAYPDD